MTIPGKKRGPEAFGVRPSAAAQRSAAVTPAPQTRAAVLQRLVKPPQPPARAPQQPKRTAHAPKAPAPYRPQATPQCLQRKTPVGRAGAVAEAPRPAPPKQPQRPSPAGLAPPKTGTRLPNAPTPRAAQGVLQRKAAGPPTRPAEGRGVPAHQAARTDAPPASGAPRARITPPAFAQRGTIQRMEQPPPPPPPQQQFNYQQSQQHINSFVLKSEESNTNDNSQTRSFSQSNRYEFRHNREVDLPDSGIDPVTKPRRKKKESDGYYYHVTSYFNLLSICKVGLNPLCGGELGGSCNQNDNEEMNAQSAKESKNKTYVATVTKLTQRYLSLRLRQEDLFNKHRAFIVYVLNSFFNYKKRGVHLVLDRFLLGEQPAVLRFKDCWDNGAWEHDPIEKQAYALVGMMVLPANIECLTIEGWVPLTSIPLEDMMTMCGRNAKEVIIRTALLTFFRKYNSDMSKASPEELMGRLAEELAKCLKEAGLPVAQINSK